MRITESKLRSIIRSVIREARDEWRDRLPGGRTQTWDIRDDKLKSLKGAEALKYAEDKAFERDRARSEERAYKRHGHDGRRGASEGSYESAKCEIFYKESGFELYDAYTIARTLSDSPGKEAFYISDFAKVSDEVKDFLMHEFNLIDENEEIERSELEDLCFNPEKLDLDPDEFELYYDR